MAEAQALQAVWMKLAGKTMPSLTMAIISGNFSSEENPQALQNAIATYGITFPVVPGNSYFPIYKVSSVPTLYCLIWDEVDSCHRVCVFHIGATGEEGILALLSSCGLEELGLLEPYKGHWAATFLLLLGGVASDAGGLGITPGGKPIPIPPWDPMRFLGRAGRDALTGLAVAELAGQLRDPRLRNKVQQAGIKAALESVKRLDEQNIIGHDYVTKGGASCGPEMEAE
jgi:hypothetical protein